MTSPLNGSRGPSRSLSSTRRGVVMAALAASLPVLPSLRAAHPASLRRRGHGAAVARVLQHVR
nr:MULTISPECIES: hypothetical protein [unclassified Acidovorax]